jgi:hypothetical protein
MDFYGKCIVCLCFEYFSVVYCPGNTQNNQAHELVGMGNQPHKVATTLQAGRTKLFSLTFFNFNDNPTLFLMVGS